MSVTSGSYVLVNAERIAREERERARNIARSRLAELQAVLNAARAELDRTDGLDAELPIAPRWPGEDASTDAYRGFDDELVRCIASVHSTMAAAHTARRSMQVRASLATDADTQLRSAEQVLDSYPTASTTPTTAIPAGDVTDTVQRLFARLRDDASSTAREAVDTTLARLRQAATQAEQDRWVVELRQAIESANEQAAARVRDADRARLLLADLQAIEAPTAAPTDELAAELEQVLLSGAQLRAELVDQVRAVVATARAAEEAALVAAAVADALGELGYDLDDGFSTALARDGLAHARVDEPAWRDHGVRIRLDPSGRKLGFHMVRAAGSPEAAARDGELEADWCDDVPEVIEHLEARGLEVEVAAQAEPGALPVVEVPAEELGVSAADRSADRRDQRRRDRRRDRRAPREQRR